jgi:hypothetical protein
MERFIETKMAEVIQDFKASVEEKGCLCDLKTLTYEGGKTPDYSQAFVQQYYMLRIFPAYLFEYFSIYQKILEKKLVTPPLNVISIGCGCGVDYYGLDHALRYHRKYAPGLRYTGVDVVRWKYRDKLGRDDSVFFLKKDISEWGELDETDYNIIMFPKSIGEFPSTVFTHIKKMLRDSTFERDRISVAQNTQSVWPSIGWYATTTSENYIPFLRLMARAMKSRHFRMPLMGLIHSSLLIKN